MVQNLKQACKAKGIEVVNLGEANLSHTPSIGCGCATMSRNDPPHLVALLDLLKQGKPLEYNIVKPGDKVNELSGTRERLSPKDQNWIITNAGLALTRMIEIAS